jgi:hypothetical protein
MTKDLALNSSSIEYMEYRCGFNSRILNARTKDRASAAEY